MDSDTFRPEYVGETIYPRWVAYRKLSLALSVFFFVLFIPTLITADTKTSVSVFLLYAILAQGFALFIELVFYLIGRQGQKNKDLAAKVMREGRLLRGKTCRALEITRMHRPLVADNRYASSTSSSFAFLVRCEADGLEFVTDEFDEVPEEFLLHRCTCDVYVLGDRAYCREFLLTKEPLRMECDAAITWNAWKVRPASY